MGSLKREQPEKVEKGEALLKQYGYEAGLFTRADSAGLLSILLLFSAAVRRGALCCTPWKAGGTDGGYRNWPII